MWNATSTTRRRATGAASAHLGLHILPFLELVGCENGFHLRCRAFTDGFHFSHSVFTVKVSVLTIDTNGANGIIGA